ncbi:protein roadkill-like [Epargyreus clarus]|uniref:protein roadkill-like n=1 Tax=Epargyreus clarus TaxID=520877 RepID=UPI003C2BD854
MGDSNRIVVRDVIQGHEVCQTCDAKWLYLPNLYEHFHRPNFYDIGGTYIDEYAEFWFMYRTEQVCKQYILHLFVCNRQTGSFKIQVSNGNQLNVNDRTSIIHLDSTSSDFKFDNVPPGTYSHLITYSFGDLDVEFMKDRKLFIAISFNNQPTKETKIPMDYVKSLHDFGQLIHDPVCADFTIESADGDKFQVHKLLLASRSEVFRAMLKDDTAESINNHVKIVDVGKEDLSCLVEFMYTGTVKDLENVNCFNLLMLADRYNIKGLKELAQHALDQQLCTENALEILRAADMYNSAVLKTSAFKFIKTNIVALESSVFQEIHNIHLMRELCKYLAPKC